MPARHPELLQAVTPDAEYRISITTGAADHPVPVEHFGPFRAAAAPRISALARNLRWLSY